MTAETSNSASGTVYRICSVAAGVPHTYSLFVKPADPTKEIRIYGDGGGVGTFILDIKPSTGSITSLAGTATGGSIVAVGAGWYRALATFVPLAAGNQNLHVYPLNAGLHGWWQAQVEAGNVATSTIPTTNATATRAADAIYLFPTEAVTRDLRRKLLLSRLRGPVLAYNNSSPASPDAIASICAWLGYVATVAYNTPFRCGVNLVGDRLGALDGKLYLTVTLQAQAFRVGVNRVGDRLLNGQLNGSELLCYLQRVLPARFQLNVIFV